MWQMVKQKFGYDLSKPKLDETYKIPYMLNGTLGFGFKLDNYTEIAYIGDQGEKLITRTGFSGVTNNVFSSKPELYTACQLGNAKLVQELLNKGVELDAIAFALACKAGSIEIFQMFLDHGFDVNKTIDTGIYTIPEGKKSCSKSILYVAAAAGHTEIVKMLFERGADSNSYSLNFDDGGWIERSVLGAACIHGDSEIVKILLQKKADINVAQTMECYKYEGIDTFSPLSLASYKGNVALVNLLLYMGADINGTMPHPEEYQKFYIMRPLFGACKSGNHKVAELLIGKGADFNIGDLDESTDGDIIVCSPLYTVCFENEVNIELVNLLLDAGADINGNMTIPEGDKKIIVNNPLHIAYRLNNNELIRVLIDRGADVNVILENGIRLLNLEYEVNDTRKEAVKLLLGREDIEVNHKNGNGDRPLKEYCEKGDLEIIRMFLDRGADHEDLNEINTNQVISSHEIGEDGDTLLHKFCRGDYGEILAAKFIPVLIQQDQNAIFEQNAQGKMPLELITNEVIKGCYFEKVGEFAPNSQVQSARSVLSDDEFAAIAEQQKLAGQDNNNDHFEGE